MTGPAVAVPDLSANPFTPAPLDGNPFAPATGTAIAPPPVLRPLRTPLAPRDVTQVGAPPNPQAVDLTKGTLPQRTAGAVLQMAQHPITTAAGIVTAPLEAARTAAQFMGQSAAETTLPPDIAARALADPERISEAEALTAGAQLAVPAAGARIIGAAASPIAKAVAKIGTGAATGAVYDPSDPAVGAVLGTGAGLAHAVASAPPSPIETAASKAARAAEDAKAAAGYPSRTIPKVFEPIGAPTPEQQVVKTPTQSTDQLISGATLPDHLVQPEDYETWDPRYRPPAGATPALAAASAEERFAGAGLPKAARDAMSTATSQAFTNPYAPIAAEHPAIADALLSAGAMTKGTAEAFGRQLAGRVTAGLSSGQAEQFETARVAANLEAEASRKANGAAATARQATQHRMEVTQLAQRDFDAETDRAEAVQRDARQRAQALAAEAPPEAPSDLDLGAAARSARQRAVAEHAHRIQDALLSGQLDADEIRARAKQDYELAIKKGIEGHATLQQAAVEKQQAASIAAREAADLRKRVPAGVENEPWFQTALERHNQMVQPFGEAAAIRAGVDPRALRTSPLGYARLTPQERIHEELVQRTQETAAAGESTTPRTGILRKAIGQKPSVTPLLPAGAEAPLQGPANTIKEAGAVAAPTASTAATGSAKAFTGAHGYSTDYVTNVARDLGDKVTKAAKNQVYQALAADAMRTGSKIRKLTPDESPAPGEKLLAFNDQKDIIQPPSKNDPNYQAVQRFAVPSDVADAFARYQQRGAPSSNVAKGAARANQLVMRSVLSNPLVAAGHTLTEASNVSRGLPAGAGPARAIATGVPGVKSAATIARALAVKMDAPETTARLQRLALSGALRLGDERGGGWVDAAHHALFGPNGVDTRMRLVASQDAEAAWTKAGGRATDPAFTAFERDYVNGHSGNYVGKNQGTAIQALNQSGLTPFIAIGRAKLGGSLQAITGAGGPAGESVGQRILRAQRGPLGQAAAIAGAGYLLSGHAPTTNAPGHEGDLATGVYHLPDGSYAYFRGDPDAAVAQFGPKATEVYLRKGFMDPASAAALRLLEPIAYAKPGDKVSESVRAAANTALAFAGPAPALTTQLATGHELYFDKDGALGSVQGVHLAKDADLTDRLVGAARNLNAGAAIGMAAPTPGARSGTSAVLGNLNPFTEARPGTAPRAAAERHDEATWQAAKISEIFQERDPARRQQLVADAVKEAADNGFTGPKIRVTLQKAAARAGVDRSAGAAIRFQNQVKGSGAPAPTVPEAAGNPFTKQP